MADKERVFDILSDYFNLGDSYHYILNRVKTAFAIGTMGLDDFEEYDDDAVDEIAEYLVDNGVIVRNNDGCDYCKEDRDGFRTMFGAFSISNPFHGDEWFINTGHCKPRRIFYCPMCGKKLEGK